MNIFALWGEIEINRKQADQDIVKVEKQAEKSGKKMESSFDKVTKVVATAIKEVDKFGDRVETLGKNLSKKAGVPLAALTALMGGLAKTTADYTATVKDNAAIVGLSAKSYQELQYAMQQSGLSQDEYLRMMGRVNQRIGFARQGNEKYRKSVEKLGISLADVDAGLVDTEDTFLAMIQYLHEMDDAQQQAAVAGDFFGVMLSRRMMPLIKDGAQSVEELRQRAHDLGLVMDDLAVAKGDLLSDTLDDLSFTAKGLGRIFGSEMHAPMINIANAITDVISGISTWLAENPEMVRKIIVWGGAIAGVLGVLVTLGATLVITGKIIGALGAVFNILTSKPLLIIAAIGALYLAWESDWLGIRTAVEDAWAIISPVIDAIIEWGHQTISTVWNWTTKTVSAFLSWVQETAWPWIDGTVSTAWDWTTGKVGEFIAWIKDTAWPTVEGGASTAWSWTTGVVSTFVTWIKDVAWPFIGGTASTAWDWSKGHWDSFVEWLYAQWGFITNGMTTIWSWAGGYVDKFVTWVKDTAWPVISGGAETAWDWTRGKVDSFILWIKDTAWPWINDTVKTTWEWTVKGLDWIKNLLGIGDKEPEIEVPGGLGGSGGGVRGGASAGRQTISSLLDAIYRAEGGAKARVPYGMTTFADKPVKYASPTDQARWEELSQGLDVGSEDYWRAAAQTTVEHYWRWFKTRFPELGEKTFDEVGPELQSMFITYLGSHFAPPESSDLNPNWVPNVLEFVGFEELSREFKAGSENIMDAWIDAIYDKAGDVETAVQWITDIVARYMIGASPPPEGPLADIDEGGANVMGAWVEGAEDGLKDGVPKLTGSLENIKNLFGTIWGKVPEEIRGPIEQAMTWMTDLIGQAEEALFKLDDFQAELDALMGGDGSPEDEAQGFMARLAAGLNDKLDQLDEPMSRLVDAVYTAGATLFEFGKAIASGNWLDALLVILMETESFAKAMELLGKVMKPIVALFDIVLRPIIEGLLKLWNGIIDALASISIFGWKPFEGLTQHKVSWDDDAGGGSGGRDGGTGGRQISEITGPTRDLLVDLLSPLANFGAIVAPIQDIRNILYERLPNFDAFGMDFAGAGAIGGDIIFESGSIVISSSGTNAGDLSRDMLDAIEREMARRVNFGIRGRGGR